MNKQILTDFRMDKGNRQISVSRTIDAPRDLVWRAWTEKEILDQWWAPKPWKAQTKTLDFRVGGHWLYAMAGPEGEKHWARADYKNISPGGSFGFLDAFCDEEGNIDMSFGRMDWQNKFSDADGKTTVDIKIQFADLKDLEKMIEMGFKEGFAAGLENLDVWLEAHSK